ncbi:YfcE family phosphodiesterase [Patescibacteria group bacterium]|nr:YfcE family phosphodiesterase [Patescibacteria group bacterium]
MKIAIISDTHDNVPNLEKALKWMKENKIEQIIHCGDLCAPSILIKTLGPGFAGPIHMVFGNVEDRDLLTQIAADLPQVTHYGDKGEIELDGSPRAKSRGEAGKNIAFVHYPDEGRKLAESGKYDLVFYGHNHKPWEEKIGSTRLINPGTLAGLFAKATFAVYDTESDNLELKILEKF